jgi:hypothetical protein
MNIVKEFSCSPNITTHLCSHKCVWERGKTAFPKNLKFFLLKFNMVCMFWIVLMC